MTLTQTCHHCGKSRAYEDAIGDRSALCWRETCQQSRHEQAERHRAKLERYAQLNPSVITLTRRS